MADSNGTIVLNSEALVTSVANSRRWWVLWTVVAAQFIYVVDAFIVNAAIPTIRADLHASVAAIEAVIAIYLIAYATLVIIGGRLGDIYGAKPVFLLGLIGFTTASACCGLAQSAPQLITARLAQGATAALMVPQVLATVHVLFPDGERARAFGIYGFALGFGGAVGFLLGGCLVTLDLAGLGWRTVFFVNAPVGLAIAWAAWRLMPHLPRHRGVQLDLAGAAVLFSGLLCLVGPLLLGCDGHWAPWLWPVMALGLLFIAGFAKLERRIERNGGYPLIESALLADRHFLRSLGAAFCFFSGNLSFYLIITLFLQQSLGYSAWNAGLVVLPLTVAFVIASRHGTARLAARGPLALVGGCAVQLAGLAGMALLVASIAKPSMLLLALPLAVFGYGQGLVMAPLSSLVLATVRRGSSGSGAGIYATTTQIANATGIAVIGTIFVAVREALSGRAACLAALAAVGVVIAVSAMFLSLMRRARR